VLHIQSAMIRLRQWLAFSLCLLVAGLVFHFAGMPMNTDLYTIAFTLVTGGAAGFTLCFFYWLVDVRKQLQRLWLPFLYMGMNAIVLYILAEGGVVEWFLSCFYIDGDPQKNLSNILFPDGVYWGDPDDLPTAPRRDVGVLMWTLGLIAVTALLAWVMFRNKYFVTI
jgi:hexosaminidase